MLVPSLIKVFAGAVAASVLWWLKLRKAILELQKVRLEIAELQRDEKQRILCGVIVDVGRNTNAQLATADICCMIGTASSACRSVN